MENGTKLAGPAWPRSTLTGRVLESAATRGEGGKLDGETADAQEGGSGLRWRGKQNGSGEKFVDHNTTCTLSALSIVNIRL